jgi:hypothetical protein
MTIAERRGTVLCALETYRYPHTVLLNREAARLPCASECQVRVRGSTRQLSVAVAAYTGAGAGVQSIAQGQDTAPMCSWAFADAGRHHGRAQSLPAHPLVTQLGRRLAHSPPLTVEERRHIERRPSFEHIIDRAGQLLR